jgi:DNA gyrase/topoisomerase IV subunit A
MKAKIAAALACLAAFAGAQMAKSVLGTVTEFKTNPFEIGIQTDAGEKSLVPFGTDTEVVQIPPGELGLGKATPAAVTSILAGDRILVSFVPGTPEARRIVLVSSHDIAKRNEAEKLDWQKRGISGIAASQKGSEITLEVRTPQGAHTAIVTMTEKTKIRRYSPDSVKFSDAVASRIEEIASGDQVRSRGLKSEDGSRVVADEVVFGTFLTRMGAITSINRETGEIQIQEVMTKKPLTIRVTGGSQLKMMPDMRAMLAPRPADHAAPPAAPAKFDIQTAMERLPVAKLDDLKVGGSVIVTSTKGMKNETVTAILLLANADFLVRMVQGAPSGGESGMDAINRLHGGMLSGPTGFSLPTMLQ